MRHKLLHKAATCDTRYASAGVALGCHRLWPEPGSFPQ